MSEFSVSEEQLADYHARRAGEHNLVRSVMSVFVLTLFAGVVLLPFMYMISISLKSDAELGSGKLVPEAVAELGRLDDSTRVWVKARLTPEQVTALTAPEGFHIGPATRTPWLRPEARLPAEASQGRVISLEKRSADSSAIEAVLESVDKSGTVRSARDAAIYYRDADSERWLAVGAAIEPRTYRSVIGRMLANYRELIDWNRLREGAWLSWFSTGFPRWFLNSLFVAMSTVLLGVFFDSLAGFAFAKYEFPFRRPLFALLVATIMVPAPVTLVPTFFIFAKLGFYNTYAALIVPGMVSAFGIFLVRQYIQSIPDDMLMAARVDGASDFALYRHIVLPTARPILAALAVFRFIWQWNTYLYPLVLTNRDSMKTVQLGLATMQDAYGVVDYGTQMAGATLAVLPILVVYAVMQKHFVHGITLGSVKA